MVETKSESYAARLNIDYPEKLDRFTTLVRLIWVIPIAIILSLLDRDRRTRWSPRTATASASIPAGVSPAGSSLRRC